MAEEESTIECVILPQFDSNLLLPRSIVVDVLDAEHMHIIVDLQGGIIGKLQWHGWTVPLLSFEAVNNGTIPKFNSKTKAVVMYALGDDDTRPYIALTVQGNPKAYLLSEEDMQAKGKGKDSDFIKNKISIRGSTEAVIPDLPTLVSYTSQYI
jgi:chemosensory pili system protein ChpC